MLQPGLSVSSVWLHVISGFVRYKGLQSEMDVGRQSFLYCPHVHLSEKPQGLESGTVPWGTHMRDVWLQCFNRHSIDSARSASLHPRARSHPSQEPHLEATCARGNQVGPGPGPPPPQKKRTLRGTFYARPGLRDQLDCLSIIYNYRDCLLTQAPSPHCEWAERWSVSGAAYSTLLLTRLDWALLWQIRLQLKSSSNINPPKNSTHALLCCNLLHPRI